MTAPFFLLAVLCIGLKATLVSSDDKVCGAITSCFLVEVETEVRSPIRDYAPTSGGGYTILCETNEDEEGRDIDFLEFSYEDWDSIERTAPYYMGGDNDRVPHDVRDLSHCGDKEILVEAYRYEDRDRSRSTLCDSKTLRFEVCPSSFFDITLELINDAPLFQENFDQATDRWETIIRQPEDDGLIGPLPPLDYGCGSLPEFVDDILICGDFAPIDGPGMILGFAGPTRIFFDPATGFVKTLSGRMVFDTDDIAGLVEQEQLNNVLLHEMAHVLGIGTLWEINGLTDESGYPIGGCPYISGSNASREWGRLSGCRGQGVLIEDSSGRSGTDCGHFDERCMGTELMTGFLNSNSINKISTITVGTLEDLGFEVDYDAADDYTRDDVTSNCRCDLGRRLGGSVEENEPRRSLKMSDEMYEMAWEFGQAKMKEIFKDSATVELADGTTISAYDSISVYVWDEDSQTIMDVDVQYKP